MKISTEQLEKLKAAGGQITPAESVVDAAVIRLMDAELIKSVTAAVCEIPDRDDMVAELKARVDNGTYAVTSDEIVDTMIRRAKADRVS